MKNTSLGYHTFSLNLKMNSLDFSIVEGDFIRYADHHKHFPGIQDMEPGKKSENAEIFAPLDSFFSALTSGEKIMESFNECLTCMRNNQAQCVSGQKT